MEPLISVIIPIYNMEDWLARCLDSVLGNTYRSLEVLCIDDGSTDRSGEILRAYAEKDSRIVPIFKENGGVSSARNAGLDRMTGEYFCFVDPDDYVHPQYVELLYRALRESGADVSICSFHTFKIDEETKPEPVRFDPAELRVYSASQVFRSHDLRSFCWGKLLRAGPAKEVRFHEELRYAEDSVFFAEVCENDTASFVLLPCPLYFYFQREGSLKTFSMLSQYMQATRQFAKRLLRPGGRDDIYLDQTIKRCLNTRDMAAHVFPDREVRRECNTILRELLKRLRKTELFGWKEKTVLSVMIRFPLLYWIYHNIKEPYLRKWARVEREKRREEERAAKAEEAPKR